jgi:HEAT repeat protein
MGHVEQLGDLIKKHEGRVEKLRALQALLADDPELADELRRMLFPPTPPGPKRVEVVVAFLKSKGDWQTAREIAQSTGLPRNTVNFLLFASKQKETFESKMRGPKEKVWRLKAQDDGIIHLPKKPKPVKETRKAGA